MRNGNKVYDADTHLRPSAESIRPYLPTSVLERIPDLEEQRVPIRMTMARERLEPPYRHWYRFRGAEGDEGWNTDAARVLGEAAPRAGERVPQKFMGTKFPAQLSGDDDAIGRLRDMNEEGVDVHFMVSGTGADHPNPALRMEFIRAGHRFLNDFCNADPSRLKTAITVTPLDVAGSVEEIKRWGGSRWAVAIHPILPWDYPLDHPDLNPIWAAAQEHNLAVFHHSVSSGYPGYRDLWNSPFLGRSASHPWGAMRAVGAFFGAGIMDRFPLIRFGILESGFGWLPFWARRMDDQAVYMGYVADNLECKLSEYMTGGRFFAAIVLHEGEDMVKLVTDDLGDHILMFGSDYPHPESRFPGSADAVLGWSSLGAEQMHRLCWDNAVHFFGEP